MASSYIKEPVIQFSSEQSILKRPKSDLLFLFAWKENDTIIVPSSSKNWGKLVNHLIKSNDFKAKEKEIAFLYSDDEVETRVAIVGLGDKKKITKEILYSASAKLGQELQKKELSTVNSLIPIQLDFTAEESGEAIAFGLLHANYVFTTHKGELKKDELPKLIKKVTFIGLDENGLKRIERAELISRGINLSRDLINTSADEMTPKHLGEVAKEIAKKSKNIKADVYDKKWLEKNKMGLILAVNRGSPAQEPAFIVLEYKGDSKSKEKTVLLGKGITYDTGGLNLKTAGMENMKGDMSGSAIVLSTVFVASLLKLKVNVTAVVPATENAIGPLSYKPGDVYTSYSGKTVEIGNTDAEGRLVLADALSWTEKNLNPTRMIDVATLTASILLALGTSCAGLFTPDDDLADQLKKASESSNEKIWRMPLIQDYKESLKSYVADTSNVGSREGGSIVAALFLQQFVEKTPWAHFDIAGVAFNRVAYPRNATGFGIRFFIDYLEQLG